MTFTIEIKNKDQFKYEAWHNVTISEDGDTLKISGSPYSVKMFILHQCLTGNIYDRRKKWQPIIEYLAKAQKLGRNYFKKDELKDLIGDGYPPRDFRKFSDPLRVSI